MHRRKFLCSCGTVLLAHPTPGAAQWTDKAVGANDPPTPPRDKRQDASRRLQGCYLSASAEEARDAYRLTRTTGIPALDVGLTNEFGFLCRYFNVTPGFFMYDDERSANAFATPERLGNHQFPHGTVCFGTTLMRSEFQAAAGLGRGDHVMVAVMAHEWAHILQFRTLSRTVPGKPMELQADYLAGWYMGVRSRQVWGGVDVMSSMRSLFGKGDYNFNSPGHHGRPDERAISFQKGLLATMQGMNVEQAFHHSARENGL